MKTLLLFLCSEEIFVMNVCLENVEKIWKERNLIIVVETQWHRFGRSNVIVVQSNKAASGAAPGSQCGTGHQAWSNGNTPPS